MSLFSHKNHKDDAKQEPPALDLSKGYSQEFVDGLVTQIKGKIIELKRNGQVIKDCGADQDGDIDALIYKVDINVGKVLQNLKKDPQDMARTGLTLESLDPLGELLERTAKLAVTGVTGEQLDKALDACKKGLDQTAKSFDDLHRGVLQIDDEILLKGLKNTIEQLNK